MTREVREIREPPWMCDSCGYVMDSATPVHGEGLPQEFFDRLRTHDRDKVDLVIVIGTSMKVAPVSEVPQIIPPEVPQIYISRDVSINTSSSIPI